MFEIRAVRRNVNHVDFNKMRQNEYLFAKIGVDTAENEPFNSHNFSSFQSFNFQRPVVSQAARSSRMASPPLRACSPHRQSKNCNSARTRLGLPARKSCPAHSCRRPWFCAPSTSERMASKSLERRTWRTPCGRTGASQHCICISTGSGQQERPRSKKRSPKMRRLLISTSAIMGAGCFRTHKGGSTKARTIMIRGQVIDFMTSLLCSSSHLLLHGSLSY